MRMETASVVLRDFAAKDAESLCRIVREPEIARFMHESGWNAVPPWIRPAPLLTPSRR